MLSMLKYKKLKVFAPKVEHKCLICDKEQKINDSEISRSFKHFVGSYNLEDSNIYQINQSFKSTISRTDSLLFKMLVKSAFNITRMKLKNYI